MEILLICQVLEAPFLVSEVLLFFYVVIMEHSSKCVEPPQLVLVPFRSIVIAFMSILEMLGGFIVYLLPY